jgi:peptidoglycan/xylan/chitin deacetylase (PgdA/CDA1 family)
MMYHDIRVSDVYKSRYGMKTFLTPKEFEFQIKYICEKYTVITTDDISNADLDPSGNYAIITFDDGLLDQYNMLGVLLDNDITATFFIPTLTITSTHIIHSHKIQFLLDVLGEVKLAQIVADKIVDKYLIPFYRDSKVKDNYWTKSMVFVTNALREHPNRYLITDTLFEKYVTNDIKAFNEQLYMNESHLCKLVDAGMHIGSHGYSSENLTLVPNPEEDLRLSAIFINRFSNRGLLSYPNGDYDGLIHYVKKYYRKAFTTRLQSCILNTYNIPRINAPEELPRE